jgi:molybdenum cofactor biosynthesis protein B
MSGTSPVAAAHRARRLDRPILAAVLTASDTRTPADDASGALLEDGLRAHGADVVLRQIVRDERLALETALRAALATGVQVIVVTGGTGVAPRDVTPEAVRAVCDRELPGFGEAFRMLSFLEIGPAATLSRALAGCAGRSIVYALPGSPSACRLALERLILPELEHLLTLLGHTPDSRTERP